MISRWQIRMDPMYYPHPRLVQANSPLCSVFDSQLKQNLKNVNNTLDETEEHTVSNKTDFQNLLHVGNPNFLGKVEIGW